jgi:hypothetical protein
VSFTIARLGEQFIVTMILGEQRVQFWRNAEQLREIAYSILARIGDPVPAPPAAVKAL